MEDQNFNGDRWTNEANRLLNRAGWEKIADSNIDVPGLNGLKHGIDSLLRYSDGFRPDRIQGICLEAKRYATTSFNATKLNDWVISLDKKIRELRQSQGFYNEYPAMESSILVNGILTIWFHDYDEYKNSYKPKFIEIMKGVNLPRGRSGGLTPMRLFVLENERILRLCSLFDKIEEIKRDKPNAEFYFYYPSQLYAAQEKIELNLEYMISEFILGRIRNVEENKVVITDVVFYFGTLHINSYQRLRHALNTLNAINNQNKLLICNYNRNDEFRKILPDVKNLFTKEGAKEVIIHEMTIHHDLPSWVKHENNGY